MGYASGRSALGAYEGMNQGLNDARRDIEWRGEQRERERQEELAKKKHTEEVQLADDRLADLDEIRATAEAEREKLLNTTSGDATRSAVDNSPEQLKHYGKMAEGKRTLDTVSQGNSIAEANRTQANKTALDRSSTANAEADALTAEDRKASAVNASSPENRTLRNRKADADYQAGADNAEAGAYDAKGKRALSEVYNTPESINSRQVTQQQNVEADKAASGVRMEMELHRATKGMKDAMKELDTLEAQNKLWIASEQRRGQIFGSALNAAALTGDLGGLNKVIDTWAAKEGYSAKDFDVLELDLKNNRAIVNWKGEQKEMSAYEFMFGEGRAGDDASPGLAHLFAAGGIEKWRQNMEARQEQLAKQQPTRHQQQTAGANRASLSYVNQMMPNASPEERRAIAEAMGAILLRSQNAEPGTDPIADAFETVMSRSNSTGGGASATDSFFNSAHSGRNK